MSPDKKNKMSAYRALIDLSSMGTFLVVSTFVGGGIGYFLDNKVFGTFPWLSIIFLFLGIVGGFIKIFDMAKRSSQDENEPGSQGK